MKAILSGVLQSFDMVTLQREGADHFHLIGNTTPWFRKLFGAADNVNCVHLAGSSMFLDNFLIDAEQHWKSCSVEGLNSGPFLEAIHLDGDIALEARALTIETRQVMVLMHLGEAFEESQKLLQAARQNLLNQEFLELEVSKRTVALHDRQLELAARLIYAAGFRDEETGAHIKRIGLYSGQIAERLGWSPFEVDDIKSAAPMHDLGKIGIPDNILKKPGRLSASEFTIMKTHASIGAEILGASDIPMIQLAAQIAESHHECWNGHGYPRGLRGEQIPLGARIVAVVDVYDALVHSRVYKQAMPESEALGIMARLSGIQFDPQIFETFRRDIDVMRNIREEVKDEG